MKCLFIMFIFAIFYRGLDTVLGIADTKGTDNGEELRQGLLEALDQKVGVNCVEATDKQCPRKDITFWLYTRETQDMPHHLDMFNMDSIRNAPFLRGVSLKVLVHGYTMDKDKAINEVLRPVYFGRGEYNIVSVDWSPLCPDHCYAPAARSVPTVGHCVAEFLSGLMDMHDDGVFTDVQVLGHSMGAHVSAWALKELQLPRLTQFDPALPLFSDEDTQLYTRPDADMVDVWHTNSALKGKKGVSGTVDIYFNDEMDQPGCKCDTSCSHLRAVQYYAETVSSGQPLTAFPCPEGYEAYRNDQCPVPKHEDLAEFGEIFTPGITGTYLAFTNSESPFIIPADVYTDKNKFTNFEKTHDEDCPKHDFMAFFGSIFNYT